jgi:hypothetical protein
MQAFKAQLPELFNFLTRKLQINLEMITTQWVMTMFLGFIHDKRIILPMLDNFLLETSKPFPHQAPWKVLFGYILAIM